MKRKLCWAAFVFTFFALGSHNALADHIAGNFRLPFDKTQAWTAQGCEKTGYTNTGKNGQYFLELNSDLEIPKYHAAEDWNGKCGGSTDKGGSLYALANGKVIFVESAPSEESIGKILIIRYTLPDGKRVDSAYYHVESILVDQDTAVVRGQKVATIGDAEGYYQCAAHLHWEIRRDLTMDLRQNPYYNPLAIEDVLKYTSPSLFVDDRSQRYPTILSQSAWTYFSVPYNAPSSTAYISYQTLNLSLKRAANAGIIHNLIYVYEYGWQPYTNITQVFFQPGKSYAIWAFNSGTTLNILLPGNKYRADRARQDMVREAQRDKRFTDVKTETYREDQNCVSWNDQYYELRCMKFDGPSTALFFQATNKSNPLLRYTGYYDPDTGSWTGWRRVNWNQLD